MTTIPTYKECYQEYLDGNVSLRKSEDGFYTIFNYKADCEFNNRWNSVNRWCRGIIFDLNETLIALPFQKFFNLNQKPETQLEKVLKWGDPVRVSEKMDSSMGTIFWDPNERKMKVATRGSFDSEQASWATQWINREENYISKKEFTTFQKHIRELKKKTLLVEIIYSKNRIVVDYGDYEGLTVLAYMDWETEKPLYDFSQIPKTWRVAKSYSHSLSKLIDLRQKISYNEEGWVLTYSNGKMIKIKGEEYLKIHKLKYELTDRRILEHCRESKDAYEALKICKEMPDEFFEEIYKKIEVYFFRYNQIEVKFLEAIIHSPFEIAETPRKELASWAKQRFKKNELSAFFVWLDKGDYKKHLWKDVEE